MRTATSTSNARGEPLRRSAFLIVDEESPNGEVDALLRGAMQYLQANGVTMQ
ncbi:hypothetical protein [Paenibacillus cymbidii]|uniref:hypothetical protein n=1 Tax=Paenibacillus cymbidii TaxID=1639034 RepID=UPI0014366D8B|nr:hypothetical protein [Paenibacillus cymbidii]